jgi:hypothetical protein
MKNYLKSNNNYTPSTRRGCSSITLFVQYKPTPSKSILFLGRACHAESYSVLLDQVHLVVSRSIYVDLGHVSGIGAWSHPSRCMKSGKKIMTKNCLESILFYKLYYD